MLFFYRFDDVEVSVGFGFDVFGFMVRIDERAIEADGIEAGSREGL